MDLSDRIKEFYENRTKQFLPRRTITLLRLDGKGFSKYTKTLKKPFDDGFSDDMDETAKYLCENIQGAKFAYTQSDEITVVLTDFDNLESQAWFDYNVQKMTSISASMATAKFNQLRLLRKCESIDNDDKFKMLEDFDIKGERLAMFDARVFQVPTVDEMINCLIWRQQDCSRNSISMAADAVYSHSKLEGKSGSDKQDLLMEEGINWNDYIPKYKRGSVVKKESVFVNGRDGELVERKKWLVDNNTPIFTKDKEYLAKLVGITKNIE